MDFFDEIDKEVFEEKRQKLNEKILERRKEMKPDRADMTFGEIINMYVHNEIIISPEFQRGFRWDKERQSRFIESLLLGIPIPPIFVAETNDGVWELVDGLQRLSTVLSFFGKLKVKEKNNLILKEGSLIKELDGFTIKTLPERYVLALKRSVCRVEIIRYDSDIDMRYELFNRLNTGGVELSEQEIRNCIFRGYSNEFNSFITKLSKIPEFKNNIKEKPSKIERMYLEELVLRYFTIKNEGTNFKENIQKHMDNYMLSVSKGKEFNYKEEEQLFKRIINKVNDLGPEIFSLSTLPFSTSMYDVIMIKFSKYIDKIDKLSKKQLIELINDIKEDEKFRNETGSSSSSKHRLTKKMGLTEKYFELL